MARVQRKSQSFCTAADEPWREKGRQGGNSPDELPGVASHLFRHPENRRTGSSHELPVQRRGNQVLHGSGRCGCSGIRAGVYRQNGDHRRIRQQEPHSVLCGR